MLRNQVKIFLAGLMLTGAANASFQMSEDDVRAMQERMNQSMAQAAKMGIDNQFGQSLNLEESETLLDSLGLGGTDQNELYVFVTWSMGEKLIGQYVRDAAATGAKVVVKGVPKDVSSMTEFLQKYVHKHVKGDMGYSDIVLDPTLFDSYGVELLPSIVFAPSINTVCQESVLVEKRYIDKSYEVSQCAPEPNGSFYKITGAVSVDYALGKFLENGAMVQNRIEAFKSYYETNGQSVADMAKEQLGDFGEIIDGEYTPHDFEINSFKRKDEINYEK